MPAELRQFWGIAFNNPDSSKYHGSEKASRLSIEENVSRSRGLPDR